MSSLSWNKPNIDISTLIPVNSLIILFSLTSNSVVTILAEFLLILLIVGIIRYKKGNDILLVDDQYEYVSSECVKKWFTSVYSVLVKVQSIIEKISKETITTFAIIFVLFVVLFISENLPAWFNVFFLLIIVNVYHFLPMKYTSLYILERLTGRMLGPNHKPTHCFRYICQNGLQYLQRD